MSNEISRLEARRATRSREKFLVDVIFPNGALHIISGPSGIGKTTWLLQILRQWSAGKQVLGYNSHPCEYVYVSLDRSMQETDRTLRRIGLEDWDFPCYPMTEIIPRNNRGKIDLEPSYTYILDRFPRAQLIVIEGLQGFMPNTGRGQSQNKAELIWAMKLQDEVLNRGITMIATTHSPKSSEYAHDRENMLGSQALIGAASTILRFDVPPDPSGKQRGMTGVTQTPDRLVTVMGRDFPNIYLNYTRTPCGGFDLSSRSTGLLSQAPDAPPIITGEIFTTHEDLMFKLDMRLNSTPPQMELGLTDLRKWGREAGMTDAGTSEWISHATMRGALLKEGGRYRKSATVRLQ